MFYTAVNGICTGTSVLVVFFIYQLCGAEECYLETELESSPLILVTSISLLALFVLTVIMNV